MTLKNTSKTFFRIVTAFLLLETTTVKSDSDHRPRETDTEVFSWSNLQPSVNLSWVDCDTGLQCARLQVPLNYSDPQGATAAIALIRVPSTLPTDSASYRGPILFNPGGPGGSGIDTIRDGGETYAELLGPEYDLVGFDPRGVGASTPSVSFFESAVERSQWAAGAITVLSAEEDSIPRAFARAQVSNKLAKQRDNNTLAHINTDQTARDMLSIVQAHGREKLQYYAVSYGTVLGATFAAMFPDKIERMVLDGVYYAEDYYKGTGLTSLKDTEKAMQTFYDSCHAAGPTTCAFYAKSPTAIAKKLSALYDTIRAHPVPVWTDSAYSIIDYAVVRSTVFDALHNPYKTFPALAQALADLAKGNGTAMQALSGSGDRYECPSDEDEEDDDASADAGTAIACNDGARLPNTLKDTVSYLKDLKKVSSFWDVWGHIRTRCSGWPVTSKTQFRGPVQGNTSFPILFIGNAADPVTPLSSAHKSSGNFPGSVVLTQNSTGHTSISAYSPCTLQYIGLYFANGTLPEKGTWCDIIGTPFSDPFGVGLTRRGAGDKGEKFRSVSKRLAEVYGRSLGRFGV